MNKRLLRKLNKLMTTAAENNNVLSKDILIAELHTNKELRTEFQLNSALEYLKNNNITVTDQVEEKSVVNSKCDDIKDNKSEIYNNEVSEVEEETIIVDHKQESIANMIQEYVSEEKENIYEEENDICYDESYTDIDKYNDDHMFNPNESAFSVYMKDVIANGTPLLTTEEEIQLSKAAKNGDEKALNKLVTSNLKLVISIAKRYYGVGLSMEDLVQEGNLGLMKAVSLFNPDLGYKFSTYATWWIRQAMTRAIANDTRIIRLPVHAVEQARNNQKAFEILSDTLHRQPTAKEVADYVNKHKMLTSGIKSISEDNVRLYSTFYKPTSVLSLHLPIGEEEHGEQSCLGDFIISDDPSTEDIVCNNQLNEIIDEIFNTVLSEKEADILMKRFGMKGYKCMTLEEVGNMYHVTRERIRQIEAKAIKKLKRSYHVKRLLTEFHADRYRAI